MWRVGQASEERSKKGSYSWDRRKEAGHRGRWGLNSFLKEILNYTITYQRALSIAKEPPAAMAPPVDDEFVVVEVDMVEIESL